MQFETLFAPAHARPVVAALIGCGEFGMSLIAQSRRMEGLRIRAVADRDVARVEGLLRAAGIDAVQCGDRQAAERACHRCDRDLPLGRRPSVAADRYRRRGDGRPRGGRALRSRRDRSRPRRRHGQQGSRVRGRADPRPKGAGGGCAIHARRRRSAEPARRPRFVDARARAADRRGGEEQRIRLCARREYRCRDLDRAKGAGSGARGGLGSRSRRNADGRASRASAQGSPAPDGAGPLRDVSRRERHRAEAGPGGACAAPTIRASRAASSSSSSSPTRRPGNSSPARASPSRATAVTR